MAPAGTPSDSTPAPGPVLNPLPQNPMLTAPLEELAAQGVIAPGPVVPEEQPIAGAVLEQPREEQAVPMIHTAIVRTAPEWLVTQIGASQPIAWYVPAVESLEIMQTEDGWALGVRIASQLRQAGLFATRGEAESALYSVVGPMIPNPETLWPTR